jgi:hypothetical protein
LSDYLDRSVYDDIADEARSDWRAECPDYDLPETCPRCKALLEDCEGHR